MQFWITFWKYLCIIAIGSYVITVLVIIPLGGRDIFRLFRTLKQRPKQDDTSH